jgi:soluble lytic murein transglycosylase-like protein
MAEDELALPPGLEIRHNSERRHGERRTADRGTRNRRQRDRRRNTARGLLFSALAFAMPHQVKQLVLRDDLPSVAAPETGPRVLVSIDSFNPIQPAHAYDDFIREAAAKYDLEPALIRSVIRMESGFDPFAVSRVGAMGLMQLMPAVAEEMGVKDPFDARQNIMGGARILRSLLERHKGNLALTLASYNAGPGAVASYGNRVPPFRETRNYVKRITGWIADERSAG